MIAFHLKRFAVVGVLVAVALLASMVVAEPLQAASAEASPTMDKNTSGDRRTVGERVVAVLFSVSQTKNARRQFRDVPNLDLLEVDGRPMILHVYSALRESKYVEKVVVVAAPEIKGLFDIDGDPTVSFVEDKGDAAENVKFGIDQVAKGDLIMFIPSDLVLVTPEGLDSLIERASQEKNVDVMFPLVSRETCESQYPEERRTYARLDEGQYTGAHIEFLRPDLFLDNSDEVKAQKDTLYDVYHMRTDTLGVVRFLGVRLTLKYLFGALSTQDIEEHVYRKYKVTAKTLYWDNADFTTDLSEPRDLQMMQRVLEQRKNPHSQISPAGDNAEPGSDTRSGV